jgi:hypothetical protein
VCKWGIVTTDAEPIQAKVGNRINISGIIERQVGNHG